MEKQTFLAGFYTIESVEEEQGRFRCEINLNPDHPIYKGHFPHMPVMPGVTMLAMVKECASQLSGKSFQYHSVKSSKFTSVVNPSERKHLTLILTFKTEHQLDALLLSGEIPVLKLKAVLKEK